MTTKFGLEIEFKGLGTDRHLIATLLNRRAEEVGLTFDQFNVVGEQYNHYVRNYWKLVPDRSVVGGCELVSPPLATTEENFELVKKVCKLLTLCGAKVDRSCGTHVHLDASFLRNLNYGQLQNFFTFFIQVFQACESKFDVLVKKHRNNNRFCESTVNHDAYRVSQDRYRKVNCWGAYNSHKTIEFRHLQGCLNGEAIVSWVKVCKTFTDNAFKHYQVKQEELANQAGQNQIRSMDFPGEQRPVRRVPNYI